MFASGRIAGCLDDRIRLCKQRRRCGEVSGMHAYARVVGERVRKKAQRAASRLWRLVPPLAAGVPGRNLSIPLRHQVAGFFCGVTSVSMVAGGWLIQTLAGSRGGLGGCRNLSGRAA
jgi:hypothetical protein